MGKPSDHGEGQAALGPTWHPHIKQLAKSLSKDNLSLVPLHKVSSTLQDVKRNGETLMLTAQSQFQKFKVSLPEPKLADDWSLLRRVGTASQAKTRAVSTMPPSSSRRPCALRT
jgi:hypothetical protein